MISCPVCNAEMMHDTAIQCQKCGFRLDKFRDKTDICILALRDTIKEMIK